MCILRYVPTIEPSRSKTTAVLWYSPAARRSKSEATTATLCLRAAAPMACVDGPGIGSASANSAVSSFWQKYCERKSSCRHTIVAPPLAASPMRAIAFLRLRSGLTSQVIWTRPTTVWPGAVDRRRTFPLATSAV